jgi:hypothetical protein
VNTIREFSQIRSNGNIFLTGADTPFFNSSVVMDVLKLRFNKTDYVPALQATITDVLEIQKPILAVTALVVDIIKTNPVSTLLDELQYLPTYLLSVFSIDFFLSKLNSFFAKIQTFVGMTFTSDYSLFAELVKSSNFFSSRVLETKENKNLYVSSNS